MQVKGVLSPIPNLWWPKLELYSHMFWQWSFCEVDNAHEESYVLALTSGMMTTLSIKFEVISKTFSPFLWFEKGGFACLLCPWQSESSCEIII